MAIKWDWDKGTDVIFIMIPMIVVWTLISYFVGYVTGNMEWGLVFGVFGSGFGLGLLVVADLILYNMDKKRRPEHFGVPTLEQRQCSHKFGVWMKDGCSPRIFKVCSICGYKEVRMQLLETPF